MTNSLLSINQKDDRIYLKGPLDVHNFRQAKALLPKPRDPKLKAKIVDLAGITRLDTAGALILCQLNRQNLTIENLQSEHQAIFDLVSETEFAKTPVKKSLSWGKRVVINLGISAIEAKQASVEFIAFFGKAITALGSTLRHPTRLRFNSVIHHMKTIGIEAIPLICVIAFVISVVIAYQGQVQLKPLGMKQYTINLVAISILREMGVLLTAIMVAGRSGSNFTAELGVMKVRQEVDALISMGFNSFELLVLPRLIALLLVLPLLTIIANIMGLIGGAIVSMSLMDIALPEYFERAHSAATWQDFSVGMIKAPVFALVIGLVGCLHGLKVSGSAESVGKETTTSVVKSIFLILILDGVFSIYFQQVGL